MRKRTRKTTPPGNGETPTLPGWCERVARSDTGSLDVLLTVVSPFSADPVVHLEIRRPAQANGETIDGLYASDLDTLAEALRQAVVIGRHHGHIPPAEDPAMWAACEARVGARTK